MTRSKDTHGYIIAVLNYAERNGLSMGGLFLLAIGIYGGQYATLFPEDVRIVAGLFCLVVAGSGLVSVLYQLALGWRKTHERAR